MITEDKSSQHHTTTGWFGITAIVLVYALLFVLNFILPLNSWSYAGRLWDWSQTALTVTALVMLFHKRWQVSRQDILWSLGLAAASSLSFWVRSNGLPGVLFQAVSAWLCYLAAVVMFRELNAPYVAAFQLPLSQIGRSLLFGAALALPLAALNNLYFYLNDGPVRFQKVWSSAFEAVYPGVHEEIVFRFFVLALSLWLLRRSERRRLVSVVSVFLAVVLHSLNHLPDLFLQNPVMGLVMLTMTSLLFGLPMALLQIKRDLASAIAFHWLIDYMRFLFGY